jgi:hypothetical protein
MAHLHQSTGANALEPQGSAKTGRFTRRGFAACLPSLCLLATVGCRPSGKQPKVPSRRLPIRKEPIPVPAIPTESRFMTTDECRRVCQVALPATRVRRFLPAYILHALRLWGQEAEFPQLQFLRTDLNGAWGHRFLGAMTQDDVYQSLAKFQLPHLLVASDFGVRAAVRGEATFGSDFGVPHFGTFLQVMAECDVPSTYRLKLATDGSYVLADVAQDDALSLHLSRELEWVTCGLARYAEPPNWINRFGQDVSFDTITTRLLQHNPGMRTCNGCHIPYALATLLSVHNTTPRLSEATAKQARRRLREWSRRLAMNQNPDGSWPLDWFSDDPRNRSRMTGGSATLDMIKVTGHHLEWMALCPEDMRPRPAIILRAARYLVGAIPAMRAAVQRDWHPFLPVSHAVRSLLLLSGTRPNEIAPQLSEV